MHKCLSLGQLYLINIVKAFCRRRAMVEIVISIVHMNPTRKGYKENNTNNTIFALSSGVPSPISTYSFVCFL